MGHRRKMKSHTLPSSPTHSSSSSDFEFAVAAAPRKSSAAAASDLRPADELFYKGQLLPLHPSPRLSMVRSLLLSSASTSSSSDATTTASRSSTSSSSSGRPSSAADLDLELKPLTTTTTTNPIKKPSKYFSLPKLFRNKDHRPTTTTPPPSSAVSGSGAAVKKVISKYLKKVNPFHTKLSLKISPPQPQETAAPAAAPPRFFGSDRKDEEIINHPITHSFSGNLRLLYPSTRGSSSRGFMISSCPSSMGSSPSHGKSGFGHGYGLYQMGRVGYDSDASSMEELQSAIQGAIAHCKNSMVDRSKAV